MSAATTRTREAIIDAVAVLALTSLALIGFRSAFGGSSFMVVGVAGTALGIAVAYGIARLKLPGLFALGAASVIFLAVGSALVVRDQTFFGVLPKPAAFTGLVDGLVSGWRRLLTTLPPSGSLGNLLAVPYVCGFVAGLGAMLLAMRTRWLGALLVLPGVVLALSVLFGTREPYSIVLQGAVFAAVAIAWLGLRRNRERRQYLQASGRKRFTGAALMLIVIASAGFVLGPHLPLAQANSRYVLRTNTEPPFDLRLYGSPLNGFDKYLIGPLKKEVLFSVTGLPAERAVNPKDEAVNLVRLAVMDDYDGVVWRVSPKSSTQGGRFIRVGKSVPTSATGAKATLNVTIGALPGIWLPDQGTVVGIEWMGSGSRPKQLSDIFRLSTVTSTGAVPTARGWANGDSYRVSVVDATEPTDTELDGKGIDKSSQVDLSVRLPDEIATLAATITKGKATPIAQARALNDYLLNGYYTAGDAAAGDAQNAPGHSLARIDDFLKDDRPVGNAEQYAAAMALMARSLGLPSRVVMGFRIKAGQVDVTGADVDAWVEIGFADGQWRTFDPTPRGNKEAPQSSKKKQQPLFQSQNVPPPQVVPPTPDLTTRQGKNGKAVTPKKDDKKSTGGDSSLGVILVGGIASGTLALIIGIPMALILLLKRRRSRRRRQAERASSRIAGGWQEYVDAARDIGLPVPPKATRREVAMMIGAAPGSVLAQQADWAVFGQEEPSDELVDEYWRSVTAAQLNLRSSLSMWGRLRARLSLTSLREEG